LLAAEQSGCAGRRRTNWRPSSRACKAYLCRRLFRSWKTSHKS